MILGDYMLHNIVGIVIVHDGNPLITNQANGMNEDVEPCSSTILRIYHGTNTGIIQIIYHGGSPSP